MSSPSKQTAPASSSSSGLSRSKSMFERRTRDRPGEAGYLGPEDLKRIHGDEDDEDDEADLEG